MFGPSGEIPPVANVHSLDANIGLAPRAAVELFQVLQEREASFDISVHANMFEVRLAFTNVQNGIMFVLYFLTRAGPISSRDSCIMTISEI